MKKIREFFLTNPQLDRFSEKTLNYLPFIFLILNYLTVIFFSGFLYFYNFDEFVVTAISKQPLPQLFDTILSEPHPPGFYLFLKFFGTFFHAQRSLKTGIVTFSYILLFLITLFAYKTKIVKKYNLQIGLSIFFLSFGFIDMTNNLKQDIISMPLLLLVVVLNLFFLGKPKPQLFLQHFFNFLLLTLLSMIGYIPFAMSCLVVGLISIYQIWKYKRITPFLIYSILAVFIGLYLYFFGFQQFEINTHRFSWLSASTNDFISAITYFLIGNSPVQFVTDLFFFSLFSGLVLAIYKLNITPVFKQKFFTLLGVMIFLIIISYKFQFFTQPRYSWLCFFILTILSGWGFNFISKKLIVVLGILFLFIIRSSYYIIGQQELQKGMYSSMSFVQDEIKETPTGFLQQSPIGAKYIKLQFFTNNSNFVPISFPEPNSFLNNGTFTKEILTIFDGAIIPKQSTEVIAKNLRQLGLKKYIYYNTGDGRHTNLHESILMVLFNECKLDRIEKKALSGSFYVFKDCTI